MITEMKKRVFGGEMKEFLKKIKLWQSSPTWIEYGVYACLAFFLILAYNYYDFKSLTIWSTNILDCLIDGKLGSYYQVTYENVYGAPHGYLGFNYLVLIPWAVWNIPIWLMQRFGGLRIVDHTLMLAWSQLFLVAMVLLIAFYSKKIIQIFTKDDYICKWSMYLILCCPFIFIAVIVAGQTDIIVIAAATIAIYYLLQGKTWVFLLWMAFSISAKPFLIFSYIAVVLLIEKNVIKMGVMLLGSVLPMFLFNIIYQNAPLFRESLEMGTTDSIIEKTLSSAIPAMGNSASVVIILLVLIYFIAYCINYHSESIESKKYVIYMMTAPMLLYMAFASYEFYRKVYLMPFLILMLAINRKFWSINILLEKVLVLTGILHLMMYGKYSGVAFLINQNIMRRLGLLRDMKECPNPYLPHRILEKLGESAQTVITLNVSVFVAVSLILLVINFPPVNKKLTVPKLSCVRAVYWLDIFAVLMFIGALFACYFIK